MSTQKEVFAVFTHPVKDYAAWRKMFDAAAPMLDKGGVIGSEVFQDPKDPNKIILVHRYRDISSFEKFLGSPELKEAMTAAGVLAPPTVLVGVAP